MMGRKPYILLGVAVVVLLAACFIVCFRTLGKGEAPISSLLSDIEESTGLVMAATLPEDVGNQLPNVWESAVEHENLTFLKDDDVAMVIDAEGKLVVLNIRSPILKEQHERDSLLLPRCGDGVSLFTLSTQEVSHRYGSPSRIVGEPTGKYSIIFIYYFRLDEGGLVTVRLFFEEREGGSVVSWVAIQAALGPYGKQMASSGKYTVYSSPRKQGRPT